ncbi:MAG: hypothetical protein K2Q18_01165, partial [Bdellovibrionales bacterium]|nr:hypothetical protein [Bdellovibrionales bacterium]
MKKTLTSIVMTITLTSSLFAIDLGEEIELDAFLNARTSPIFSKDAKNFKITLPPKTKGSVLELKKFSSGNAGIKIKISEGPRVGQSYWVYYNKNQPQIKVLDKASNKEITVKVLKETESDLKKLEAETISEVRASRDPDEVALTGTAQRVKPVTEAVDSTLGVTAKEDNCEACGQESTLVKAPEAPKPPDEISDLSDADCTTVNLTAPNQPFNGIPTYDQEGSQLCYAYTATQMLEGQRSVQGHKYSVKESIAPLSLAYRYALANNHPNLQKGGITCLAVEFARANPVCPASKSFTSSNQIENHLIDFKNCQENSSTPKCIGLIKKWKTSKNIFAAGTNPFVYIKAIEDMMCSESDKIILDVPACNYLNDETKSSATFQKMVNSVFSSKNPTPVQIGYSMNLISYSGNEKKSYIIRRDAHENDLFSLIYKPHSSILLGRRKAPSGQCQYLLRNTQGKSFCPSGIVKINNWECDSKSEGIWINATELFESTFEVSSLGQ